jgi:hypothetical protein
MKVIAELIYDVDDESTLKQAFEAIRNAPKGSTLSSKEYCSARFVRLLKVKKEVKPFVQKNRTREVTAWKLV